MRGGRKVLASAAVGLALLLATTPAHAANVSVVFQIGIEQSAAHYASCTVSVPARANAAWVLRAASRRGGCNIKDYELGYDQNLRKHYVLCIDLLCNGTVSYSGWYQGNPPLPPAFPEVPGHYIEDFHARNGAVLAYTYYSRACVVVTFSSYACV